VRIEELVEDTARRPCSRFGGDTEIGTYEI
jgi:hypothetical protein